MRSDYTKQKPSRYREKEREAELMTINRQINYGYRGTTPNYFLGYDIEERLMPKTERIGY